MNHPIQRLIFFCLPLASALAQQNGPLLTFSQTEYSLVPGGGPLQQIHPNEIAFLHWPLSCNNGSQTVKWCPRTCFHAMAGDENGDGQYWNPTLFGTIDALAVRHTPLTTGKTNPAWVYWSPSAPMGNAISASPIRPGDVGRIWNGQVELLISQEHFNMALGLPASNPLDVDAIAYEVGIGIFFSLDDNLILANPGCTPQSLVRDGDLLAIPDGAIAWSLDYRVMSVAPNSAYIVKTEGQFSAMLANSQVTDRNGAAITTAIDLESIDIYTGPGAQYTMFNPCGNVFIPVPEFVFSTQSMTGGSLVTTVNGGQCAVSSCGYAGFPLPLVQTGAALGLQGTPTQGPPSYVNGLAFATTERFVLEPLVHQQYYNLGGGPPTTVYIGTRFPLVFTWVELVAPTVPSSQQIPWPYSPNCFPYYYFPSNLFWNMSPTVNGYASFPTVPIPVGWSFKMLFQSCAVNGSDFEFSTPALVDVN